MKKSFQEQFQNLKIIIETNVTAIRALLQQSESLSNIINTLGTQQEGSTLKPQLEELKKNISSSVDVLVNQTQKLFETYEKLTDEMLDK